MQRRWNRSWVAVAAAAALVGAACVPDTPGEPGGDGPTIFEVYEDLYGSYDAFEGTARPAGAPIGTSIEQLAALTGGSISTLHERANELAAATPEPTTVEVPGVDWSATTPDSRAIEELAGIIDAEGSAPAIIGFAQQHVGEGALDDDLAAAQRERYASAAAKLSTTLAGTASKVTETWDNLPLAAATIDRAGLDALAADAGVAMIVNGAAEAELTLDNTVDVVETDHRDWAPDHDGAGAGQMIAVIDTGVDDAHPAFADGAGGNRIRYSACLFSMGDTTDPLLRCPNGSLGQLTADSTAGVPCLGNACDHGTHVAGIAAGNDVGGDRDGVAPAADLMSVRMGTINCLGPFCIWLVDDTDFVNAFSLVDLIAAIGEPVAAVNGSFRLALGTGETCQSHYLSPVFANLRSRNVSPVIAAGNSSQQNSIDFPACSPDTISVAATTDADTTASFTNVDHATDLWAPGVAVNAAVPGGGYADKDGTSMAAPHVAGAIAAIKDDVVAQDPDSIRSRLRSVGYLRYDDRLGGSAIAPRLRVSSAITPWGFLRNDGSGQVNLAESYSSEGTAAMAEVGTGLYLVALDGVLDLAEASPLHVTPLTSQFRRCAAEEVDFFAVPIAVVACRDSSGNLASSDFFLQTVRDPITEAQPSPNRHGASLRVDDPVASGVTIPTDLNVNPSGDDNLVLRVGAGEYLAVFPGTAWAGQSFLATHASYTESSYCKPSDGGAFFGLAAAAVRCYTPSGALTDAAFDLTMVSRSGPFPGLRHHATADQPTAAQYHPSVQGTTHWGTDQTHVYRLGTGRYRVEFGGWPIGAPQPRFSYAVGSAGNDAAWCQARNEDHGYFYVDCRNPAGAYVDSPFHVASFADHLGYN